MSLTTVLTLNTVLDAGIVAAVAWVTSVPFGLERQRESATVYAFATPLPLDLAA